MKRLLSIRPLTVVVCLTAILLPTRSMAIERDEILAAAKTYEEHQWTMEEEHLVADCALADWECTVCDLGGHIGLPYCWGGFDAVDEFDQKLSLDYAAGSAAPGYFPDCTTGVDCSGYVSLLWELPYKHGTSTLPNVSTAIEAYDMYPGDVYNFSGSHVIMWVGKDEAGEAVVTEAGYMCMGVCEATVAWSHFASYTPRRADVTYVQTATQGTNSGTEDDPIAVETLPFRDWRNTNGSSQDSFDVYSIAPTLDESGPEYIYELEVPAPGTILASVLDAPQSDIDLHLLGSLDPDDCLARGDRDLAHHVNSSGTFYIVADSWVGAGDEIYSGAYVLDLDFQPDLVDGGPDIDVDSDVDTDQMNGPCINYVESDQGCACNAIGDRATFSIFSVLEMTIP